MFKLLKSHMNASELPSTISFLPNYSTAGSYCFLSQVVNCNSIEEKDMRFLENYDRLSSSEYHGGANKAFPLIMHEIKHWYDNYSTLWGMRLILETYSAKSILIKSEMAQSGEQDFFILKNLYDKLTLIKYPEYYFTKPEEENSKPWAYNYSKGLLFKKDGSLSDRPIFFMRAQNHSGNLIARVPFSLCALLETSAVATELRSKVELARHALNEDELKIEMKLLSNQFYDEMYDPNLAEYSVAAHKVANSFNISDPVVAYTMAADIIRLLLNFPQALFKKINVQSMTPEFYQLFTDAYIQAKKYKDIAGLYPLFVDALKLYSETNPVSLNVEHFLHEDLHKAMISMLEEYCDISEQELIDAVSFEMNCLLSEAESLGDQYVILNLQRGKEIFRCSELLTSSLNLESLGELGPTVVLGDMTMLQFGKIEDSKLEDRYFHMQSFFNHLSEFSDACIA